MPESISTESPEAGEHAERIARLLQSGLDRYGEDDVDAAIEAWREVLALDPQNAEARDYLESAGGLDGDAAEDPAGGMARGVLDNVHDLLSNDDFEAAYQLLSGAGASSVQPILELEAMVELVRSELVRRYRREVGDLGLVPVLGAGGGSLTDYNLPTEAGFVLSLVDGATPIEDLISLSGMDPFEALQLLRGLNEAGIVELGA